MSASARRLESALRAFALSYPGAVEDFPWGERAIKVKGKIFALVNLFDRGELSVTVKLPQSEQAALALLCAKPTGYGLGKSGWVTLRFLPPDAPPTEVLREWIDESYRAIAPKRMVAALGGT